MPIPRRPRSPNSPRTTYSSPLPEYQPHQNPLPEGLPPGKTLAPMPNLSSSFFLSELSPPQKTSPPGPSHTRTVSPSPHPLPRSGLARGPREAGARWGPQWGGRTASMAVAVKRRPPVPARPARQASRLGGQAGQAARWVTTAAAAGGGERRERGSARGMRGKGKAGGRGRGGLTRAPPRGHPPPGTSASRPPTLEARPGPRSTPLPAGGT